MLVVDGDGTIIFNSESAAENTDYWYCGYGDGTILVVEYISDFSNNVAYICEMNLQGEITDRTEIDTPRASYTYADFRYRGNDIFIGTAGYSLLSDVPYWIYNSSTNNFFKTSSEERNDFSSNGLKLYSNFSEGYALGGNGKGSMYQIPLESLSDENAWISFANKAASVVKLNSSKIEGRAIAHITGIYDEYGQLIGTYPEGWNVSSVSGFSGEYVVLSLRGADSNNYICIADKNGTPQYEPIRCDKYISSKNGYVLIKVGNEEKIYNVSGTEISRFEYLILNSDSTIWAYDDEEDTFIDSTGNKLEHIYVVSNYGDIAGKIYPYPYSDGVVSEDASPANRNYITLDNFNIEGKWKNTGSYTFGQVQNGAIVVFDGTNCNFFSPNDTYAFYFDNANYHLDCTSPLADTLSFVVKIIDENNIDIYNGTNYLALTRAE